MYAIFTTPRLALQRLSVESEAKGVAHTAALEQVQVMEAGEGHRLITLRRLLPTGEEERKEKRWK